jgi:hypothetical protein
LLGFASERAIEIAARIIPTQVQLDDSLELNFGVGRHSQSKGLHMDHARCSLRPRLLAIALLAAMGCFALQPRALTGAKAQSERDTVTALESAMNLAVDRLDCTAGFASIGDLEPIMVSSGRVRRTRATFRARCDTMVAP